MALSDLRERGDAGHSDPDGRSDAELRRTPPRTALEIQRDSWLVVIVLVSVMLVVPAVGAAWLYHRQWANRHLTWSYDDYRRGYAVGVGHSVPAGTTATSACKRAADLEYPAGVRREARGQPWSRVGVEVSMFNLGCIDSMVGLRSDPGRHVAAERPGDD